MKRGGELLVEGELSHVFMDLETGGKRPIPDDIRRALAGYVEEIDSADSEAEARA